jgi:hypothetical protein
LRHNLQDLFHQQFEVFFAYIFFRIRAQNGFDFAYPFYGFGYIKILSDRRLYFVTHLDLLEERFDGLALFAEALVVMVAFAFALVLVALAFALAALAGIAGFLAAVRLVVLVVFSVLAFM